MLQSWLRLKPRLPRKKPSPKRKSNLVSNTRPAQIERAFFVFSDKIIIVLVVILFLETKIEDEQEDEDEDKINFNAGIKTASAR
jgi:hypothetical protein